MKISDLLGKKIAILGVGLENISLSHFLLENGVFNLELRDKRTANEIIESLEPNLINEFKGLSKLPFKSGEKYLSDLNNFDVIFRTPGIPYLTKDIQEAKKHGVIIYSQIKLFFDLCPAKIIGVTGTKGKGTTAKLIESILLKEKSTNNIESLENVFLLGNIGKAAVSELKSITLNDLVILELSSFQLQDLHKSPHIAVITNLGEDHLDYHQNINEYWGSKSNILAHQKNDDYAVINQDYLSAVELSATTSGRINYFSGKNTVDEGAYVKKIDDKLSEVILIKEEEKVIICNSKELLIVGHHNLENIAAASVVASILGINPTIIHEAIINYCGLEHRLEFVASKNGINYYNDSYATNPISTIAAINSFQKPIVLILGGSEKGTDYSELVNVITDNRFIKQIIYIGVTGQNIKTLLEAKGFNKLHDGGKTMKDIVANASKFASKGDVVLLSTASASFGLFKNYKDRGLQFKKEVLNGED